MLLFVLLAPLHVATKLLLRRSPWPQWFLAAAARICGARVELKGHRAGKHTLLIANHTSWLDILILGGSVGCAFVSKDELGHRFIHWLADQNSTVYVKRTHRKGAKDQAVAVAKALGGRKPITIFPEGTTGPGTHLLPFRSTLLEAVNVAPHDVRVRPVMIDYGAARAEVGWFEESGSDNVKRILSRRGPLWVTVHVFPPLEGQFDRKKLAHEAREAIAQRLGLTSPAHSPIGGRQ